MEELIADQFHAGETTNMTVSRTPVKDLQSGMFGGKTNEEVIDSYEEEKGIKKKKEKKKNLKFNVQIFDITKPSDKHLYVGLLNNPRYMPTSFKDNFSNITGKYSVVIHYAEDLDSEFPPVEPLVEEA